MIKNNKIINKEILSRFLGLIWDFRQGGSRTEGGPGTSFNEIFFKIEFFRNAISGILRPRKRAMASGKHDLAGFARTPSTPSPTLDPPEDLPPTSWNPH